MEYLDRIAEGYEGLLGESLKEKSQKRIDWICAQAQGSKVLDIGCSQGICEVLLGRCGFQVTGIDIAEESIAYARKLIDKEPFNVKLHVQLICADFLTEVELEEKYDTILLTEILEHLEDPEVMVAKAAEYLCDGGRMIVTVPFGINDFPDHKHTFYMADIGGLLSKWVRIDHVEFMNGWIGFSCTKSDSAAPFKTMDQELVLREEKAFFALERPLRDKIKKLFEIKEKQQKYYDDVVAQYEDCKVKITEAEEESQKQAVQITILQAKQTELENEFRKLQRLKEQEEEAAREKAEQEEEAARKKAELAERQIKELESTMQAIKQAKEEEAAVLKKYLEENRVLKRRFKTLNNRYMVLQKSLFGRLQFTIWNIKNHFLYLENSEPGVFRNILKRIPGLKGIVNFLRGNQSYRTYYGSNLNAFFAKPAAVPKEKGTVTDKAKETKQMDNISMGLTPKEAYYNGRTDADYFDRITPLLADIADSNGSKYYEKSKLRVGCVIDEFQYNTYHDVAEFIYLRPDDYKREIDILMIVSPWRGIDLAWKGIGNPKNRTLREQLFALIKYYREQKVKTVFYSKEDPVNYQVFLEIAQECDYIFTTEQDSISDYVRDTGKDTVFYLPFGINPLYHNPIGVQKHALPEIVFSGTWWGYKYEERIRDQTFMMEGVLRAGKGLKLIDRNYGTGDMRTAFPEKYLPFVSPSIGHKDLQKVHKLYTWSINLNSIKYSSTMFASRVVELQALGCNIISNYSKGMLAAFPYIPYAKNESEVAEILCSSTEESLYEARIAGIRRVMSQETVYHRFDYILSSIGMPVPNRTRKVLVIVEDAQDNKVREMFEKQSYKEKELIAMEMLTEERLLEYDCYTFFRPDYEYGPYYLEDMINAFKYTNSDFVTKDAFYKNGVVNDGIEHDYVEVFHDRFKTIFWNSVPLSAVEEDRVGWNGYSVDHLNLSVARSEE